MVQSAVLTKHVNHASPTYDRLDSRRLVQAPVSIILVRLLCCCHHPDMSVDQRIDNNPTNIGFPTASQRDFKPVNQGSNGMAKQKFAAGETNRAEAVRGAVTAVGPDSANSAVKEWMAENWTDFKWGTNPAAEIFAARSSLKKAAGVTIAKKGERENKQPTVKAQAVAAKTTTAPAAMAATSVRSAMSLAVQLLAATDDPKAALEKARRIVEMAGSSAKALEIVNLI